MHGIYLVLLGRAPKGNQDEGHHGIEQQEVCHLAQVVTDEP